MIYLIASADFGWPDAIAMIGVAWAVVVVYAIWRLTGGKHYGEKGDR